MAFLTFLMTGMLADMLSHPVMMFSRLVAGLYVSRIVFASARQLNHLKVDEIISLLLHLSSKATSTPVRLLCEEIFEWRLKEHPEFATFCGNHQYDAFLNDHSQPAFYRRKLDAEAFKVKCNELKNISMSEDDRLDLLLITNDIDSFAYPLSFISGFPLDFHQLLAWMKFETSEDFEVYSMRLKALPPRLGQDIENMRYGMKTGKMYHSCSMIGNELANVSNHWNKLHDILFAAEKFDEHNSQFGNFKKRERLIIFKMEYLTKLRAGEGLCHVPNGKELYKICLRYHLSLDMDPQEVHDIGMAEVKRIRAEMDKVSHQLGNKDFSSLIGAMRNDPQFYFTDTESLMKEYRRICDQDIRPRLSKLFHKIPESKLVVEPTPVAMKGAPTAFYLAGTLDGSRPGKVSINCHQPEKFPKYEMMTLALHEGEPGHHFQGMYAIESTKLPSFRRYMEDMNYNLMPTTFNIHTAYAEGWGLYCEYLGHELGLYTDPYDLLGHLSFEMHRACRLVVDTGIHYLGWSQEQAVQLCLENSAMSEVAIRREIKRYCTWPGQACAYKIGQLKVMELRNKAENDLGIRFDVRDFHEVVLQCGMVPLSVLEKLVLDYIESKK
ncbi:hypothetical protein CAPTEDRAFT_225365 [Capitella teleta]|uniref:DUF885 domain-containing protein n=1 Tax=Capitella teleta TaxID=283909 RepID=R7TVH9_CAPTE|nr:hypothetical protein CAPTEDRAFT_225365 [Capitella teleta]|eukprot:ELT97592.1 hypothetical protein CAPTEDRAFT_225365 [Capitella teleta]